MASNKNRLQDPVADSLLPLSFLVYLKLKQKVTGVTEELQLITFLFFYLYFLIKKIANFINPLSHLSLLHRFFSKDSGKLEKHNRLFQISRHVLKKPKISLVSY